MCSKKNISHVQSKVNIRKKKAYVGKDKKGRNTTPVLSVKTLASQGTPGKVIIVGEAAPSARIKMGEEWGDVTGGSDQRGRIRSRGAYDGGGCVWNVDDNRGIVVGCMRKTNHGDELSGFVNGGSRGRGNWS